MRLTHSSDSVFDLGLQRKEAGPNRTRPDGVILPQSISSRSSPQSQRNRPGRPWIAFVILLVLLAGAVLALYREFVRPAEEPEPETPPPPSEVAGDLSGEEAAPQPPADPVVAEQPVEPEEAIDPATALLNRRRAEDALSDLLERTRSLERKGVTEWGGDAYADVLALSQSGDQWFLEKDFEAALGDYDKAVAACDILATRLPEALDQLLEAGSNALVQTNGVAARRLFDAALKIDAANDAAQIGLRRATTIDQVAALLASATTHEDAGRFALALTDYREAADLDPLFEEAAAAIDRVSEVIKQTEFGDLMTKGIQSLRDGDLDEAGAMFARAGTFYPGAPEVEDAQFQVAEARRLAQIRQLQRDAADAEQDEEWRTAYDGFQKILAIDPHIRSAQEGKERNALRVRLQAQMQFYLDRAEELQTDSGRESALLTLHEAQETAGGGTRWEGLVTTFEERVTLATTPVAVLVESDAETRVDIYQVGRFEPFESKSLSLLPGKYTVVGHRGGYKDVRMVIVVPPGEEPVRVVVQCVDRIR